MRFRARAMWTLFEPIHAVTYFTAEARSAYEQAGLRGFWRGYFAGPGGAARLRPVRGSAAVVAASFFNFAPAFVARAIPGVWELITPEEALRVRLAGAAEGLGRLLAGQEAEAAAAADLLWRAIGELDFSGRVLAAANAALPVLPGEDVAASSASFGLLWPLPGWAGCGRRPRCCASTGATGISPRWRRRTSTAARRWSCAAAWTCAGRTCSRCGAGPTRRGTAPCPGWPRAAGSARTAR